MAPPRHTILTEGDVTRAAIEHDLLDKAAQQRLALSIRGACVGPDLR